jgi:hypothetical protein
MPEPNALSPPDAAYLGAAVAKGMKLIVEGIIVEGINESGPLGVLEEARKTAHGFRSPSVPWRVRIVVYYPRVGESVAFLVSEP